MYKYKEEKLTQNMVKLTCDDVKRELQESIDEENKRINIDSAKKRAVLQHMDYDNFRQMVLGANIKPVKSAEMNDLMSVENQFGVMNASSQISFMNKDQGKQLNKVDSNALAQDIQLADNFREFKKYFDKILKLEKDKTEQLIVATKYLDNIPKDRYKKVFGVDMETDYFLKVMKLYEDYLQTVNNWSAEGITSFLGFLEGVSEQETFAKYVVKFISKQEKEFLNKLFTTLEEKTNAIEGSQENSEAKKQRGVD